MPPSPANGYQHTQPMDWEPAPAAGQGVAVPEGSAHRPAINFDATQPLDWEQQALAPDYDEVIAAMATGEVVIEPDYTGRRRVLVVDDDVSARMYLRAKLSLMDDVDVYEAANGDEAVHISQFTPFDGVLLDVNMTGQDGYAVCRAIKRNSKNQGSKPPKIYIVTSRSGVVDRLRATLAGADAFLSKPPHPAHLHALLASL
jgi:CheY-like chemotaxis protein